MISKEDIREVVREEIVKLKDDIAQVLIAAEQIKKKNS